MDYLSLRVLCCSKPTLGYLSNALGEVATEQHPASTASPKSNIPISKVKPPSVGTIWKGPTCTKKISKAGGVWIGCLGRIMGIFGDRRSSSSSYSDDEAFGGAFIRIRCYKDDGLGVALRPVLGVPSAAMIGV
ncbi:hypothetical protein CMV_026530 [Castanea mollissima]|uniref:Uncharacterized protein n=1 Tax=Castanea mollissima TaxID=60419 RepID=A0A8J4VAB6_9ROSI|nr:hypothetical protein CMV_026530 [Castanea mollissima]